MGWFKNIKRAFALVLTAVFCLLCGCGGEMNNIKRGLDDYAFTKASFSAVDREGRTISAMHKKKTDHERYVGVFYFLWMGTHVSSAGVYDVTKLQQTEEGAKAVLDPTLGINDYLSNGLQSPTYYVHWTTEPLYGYYNSCDPWVIARHIELLTMADVDFVFFDTTNDWDYSENKHTSANAAEVGSPTYAFLDTLLEYYNQGWDVPQVVFYTNNRSGERVEEIYNHFYLVEKYQPLWFAPFGKPMIVGTTEKNRGASDMSGDSLVPISPEMCEYFDVRESQWPSRASKSWGFPWMDWTKGDNFYFEENKMVNVSVAQHGHTITAYSSGDGECSRGWDEANEIVEENWAAGKNIEDQWDTVFRYEEMGKTVEMVTVSCWNEWLAWKYVEPSLQKVIYIDNFNAENSRDIEMDKTYYQDNFYLQLVRNVRKYKYSEAKDSYQWQKTTIRSMDDFDAVPTKYKDMVGDARKRDFWSFDIRTRDLWYLDESNRNDIAEVAVAHDDQYLYFRITAKDAITPYEGGENWMNVLIKPKNASALPSFEGYRYLINRAPQNGKASVDVSLGGWSWQNAGYADMTIEGNRMMIAIPLSMLGLTAEDVSIEFKVADNVTEYQDIMDYYVSGDSAPIGRLNYAYGY